MSMQQTSLLAFDSIQDKLNEKQSQVLEAIEEHGPICNRELAHIMRLPINSVTPRCQELRKKGKVETAFIGTDEVTGRRVHFWRATSE